MTEEELIEEKKKRPQPMQAPAYEYSSPQGTYYGEQGNDRSETMRRLISDYVNRTDPQKQAEEDARIQRGRNFWTGASLFANVVGNAINVNGTANGAPSMTWDNDMEKAMYARWQDADKQLNADRKEAQRRLETLRLQDAEMADAGAAKRVAEDKAAYDMDYKARAAAVEAANKQANADFDYWRGVEQKKAETEAANEEWTRRNEIQHNQNVQLQRMRTANARGSGNGSKGGSGGGGKTAKAAKDNKNTVYAGPLSIPAADKGQAENIRRDIARRIVDRLNKGKNTIDRAPYPSTDKEAQKIIYQNMDDMYANDPQFAREIDSLYGGAQQQADTLAPVQDTVAPVRSDTVAPQPRQATQPSSAPVQRPASRGLSGVFNGGRTGGLQSGTPTNQRPRQAQPATATETVQQPVRDTVGTYQPATDTIEQQPAWQEPPQRRREVQEGSRYVKMKNHLPGGKDFVFRIDGNGDVYLLDDDDESFVGNESEGFLRGGTSYSSEEYANLGQWQRRPSAKNNPMMAMPDLSVEKTKEFNDWFKNNTKK